MSEPGRRRARTSGLPASAFGSTPASRVIFLPDAVNVVTSMSTDRRVGNPRCTGATFCEQ